MTSGDPGAADCSLCCDWLLGTDVFVRCLKLLKPYGQKEVEEEEDDENNDEEGEASAKRNVLAEPRFIERDVLTQAYDIGQTRHMTLIMLTAVMLTMANCNYDHICDSYNVNHNYDNNI